MCAPTDFVRPAWMDEPTNPYHVTDAHGVYVGVWDAGVTTLAHLRDSGHTVEPVA